MARHPADVDLDEALDDEFAFWPLNLVLLLLGTTILGVAFFYLDAGDRRLIYNPWTYAVATPVVLFVLSLTLKTIVSRLVQKSMQMAFLLSVLMHLFLLIGAMNIVIFSRMWPDLIESMARERHQLKRESLQAKQYVSVTSSRSNKRPDYLRHVPTTHQPTELEQSDPPSLNLTRSTVANLVSPSPSLEKAVHPHLLERKTPQPTQPSITESAASLSKSETQRQLEVRAVPDPVAPAIEANPAPSLQPSAVAERRSSSTSREAAVTGPAAETTLQPLASPSVRFAERDPGEPAAMTPNALAQPTRQLSRAPEVTNRRLDFSAPSAPTNAPAATATGATSSPEASGLARTERREAVVGITASPLQPSESLPSNPASSLARRRDTQQQVPSPAAGAVASPLARSTAGGESGLPAASSMPIQGPANMAARDTSNSPLVSPRVAANRRSRTGNLPASLPEPGTPTAPAWDSQPAITAGSQGRTPSDLAQAEADGQAASPDVARLDGAGPSMQRAVLGLPGNPGPLASPQTVGDAPAVAASSQAEAARNPSAEATARRRQATDSPTLRSQFGDADEISNIPASGPQPNLSGPSAARATGVASTETISEEPSVDSEVRTRTDLGQRPPSSLAVDVGEIDAPSAGMGGGAASERLTQDDTVTTRRRSGGNTTLLALNEPPGPGGISPIPHRAGDLLPRRTAMPQREAQPDFTIQRFERQSVGGPVAAGQIAVPKPAFQQRLERLQDRDPLDISAAEPATELAIERGLAFLAKYQRPNGCWRLQDFDTPVLMTSDTAATGLALLAFQGAGYTHKQFRYVETVDKAIQFLRQSQLEDGDLYVRQDPASDQNAWLYSHAIATLALCEAYGMTQDVELREPAQRAIDFMVASQDRQLGGWRYRPGAGADTSVSGWFMMAFESAELAGLRVPQETLNRMQAYLEKSQVADAPHLYRYNPYAANTPQQRHGLKPTAVMTSVGLLMRLYSGWQRDLPAMQQGAAYLMSHPPEHGTPDNSRRDTYYWYYATQVMFHMGGDTWQQWHDQLYPLLIKNQILEGELAGSWDPFAPTPDLWSRYGGRLYVTTLNLLSLEVSYRHLPLYDATGARD